MHPLVAILSNPGSTTNRRIMGRVRELIQASSFVMHIEIRDFADVPAALAMFARVKPTVLVINGGDGTLHATLSALINDRPFGDRPPPLAVLPGGKTNMVAKDLGVHGSAIAVLRRIIALAQSGGIDARLVERAVVGLDVGDGKPVRYGMFFGAAGVIGGIRSCRKYLYPLNLPDFISHIATVLLVVFSILVRGNAPKSLIHTAPMRINLKGGGILDGAFFFVVAYSLERLLLGIDPALTRGGEGGLRFTAVEFRRATILRVALAVLLRRFGRRMIAGVHFRTVNVIRISTEETVTLDGEMIEPVPGKPLILDGSNRLTFVKLAP